MGDVCIHFDMDSGEWQIDDTPVLSKRTRLSLTKVFPIYRRLERITRGHSWWSPPTYNFGGPWGGPWSRYEEGGR